MIFKKKCYFVFLSLFLLLFSCGKLKIHFREVPEMFLSPLIYIPYGIDVEGEIKHKVVSFKFVKDGRGYVTNVIPEEKTVSVIIPPSNQKHFEGRCLEYEYNLKLSVATDPQDVDISICEFDSLMYERGSVIRMLRDLNNFVYMRQ